MFILNKNLKIIAEQVGLQKHITFHSSRHTFATRALSKGMKLHHVGSVMGHASVKTTEIYAKIINKDLDDAMGVFDEWGGGTKLYWISPEKNTQNIEIINSQLKTSFE